MLDRRREANVVDVFFSLGEEIEMINRSNGWDILTPDDWDGPEIHLVPTKLALIHSEISEALEAYRTNDRSGFDEELADAIIRILDVSHGLKTNLGEEVLVKMSKNRDRGYRHGGKKV